MNNISLYLYMQVMRVKLQPPTSVELSAYNPIMPPPSISQVMLLANPSKVPTYMTLNECSIYSIIVKTHEDIGLCDSSFFKCFINISSCHLCFLR